MTAVEKIGFIGGGNMAEALIKGLLAGGFRAADMMVSEPVAARRQLLQDTYGIAVAHKNEELVSACGLVVLAIKPQIATDVLSNIAPVWDDSKLLVSILAGVSCASIERTLAGGPRVVRVMPNTPALIAEAASAICSGRHADAGDLQRVQQLFEHVGMVHLIDERQMDAVTGLSGSGPAYVYMVIEALADGGVREGLPRHVAQALAVQTVVGAALMVRETGTHPALLRDQVCSPGGTTIAGVSTLEKKGLRSALIEAVSASTARSRELGGH